MKFRNVFIIGIIIVLVVVITCVSCVYSKIHRIDNMMEKSPMHQQNTKWKSEDGSIVFYTDEQYHSIGRMTVGEVSIDIMVTVSLYNGMEIYPLDTVETNEWGYVVNDEFRIERWSCSYDSKTKCTVKVEETTYFKKGQRITLCRVDDDTALSEQEKE